MALIACLWGLPWPWQHACGHALGLAACTRACLGLGYLSMEISLALAVCLSLGCLPMGLALAFITALRSADSVPLNASSCKAGLAACCYRVQLVVLRSSALVLLADSFLVEAPHGVSIEPRSHPYAPRVPRGLRINDVDHMGVLVAFNAKHYVGLGPLAPFANVPSEHHSSASHDCCACLCPSLPLAACPWKAIIALAAACPGLGCLPLGAALALVAACPSLGCLPIGGCLSLGCCMPWPWLLHTLTLAVCPWGAALALAATCPHIWCDFLKMRVFFGKGGYLTQGGRQWASQGHARVHFASHHPHRPAP
nr:hypothetical protein CFP56_49516 [Quercus suber]